MGNIEEVKKILIDMNESQKEIGGIVSKGYINRKAKGICQLFPKSPDNPDGYEGEAKAIDCQAECRHYQRCYPFVNPVMCTKSEPKPDEGRLLTPQEHSLAIIDYMREHGGVAESDKLTKTEVFEITRKAQRDLTASTKDAECQERVERIFKEIEKHRGNKGSEGITFWFYWEEWQTLKK